MTNNAWNTPYPDADGEILIGNAAGRPSAANITGDADITITNGAGSIQIDNIAAGSSDLVKISSTTASSDSSVDFTGLSSTYFAYIITLTNVQPETDEVELWFRTSTDNGSNFDDSSSDYAWNSFAIYASDGTAVAPADASDSKIKLFGHATDELTTTANKKLSGVLYLFNPSASKFTFVISQGFYSSAYPDYTQKHIGGYRLDDTAVDAIRFLMSSGNIDSGIFTLYGVVAS